MVSTQVLEEALALTTGDRRDRYGDPVVMYGKISKAWCAYLGITDRCMSGRDVVMMLIIMKTIRDRIKPHSDNLVDIAGYAGIAADT